MDSGSLKRSGLAPRVLVCTGAQVRRFGEASIITPQMQPRSFTWRLFLFAAVGTTWSAAAPANWKLPDAPVGSVPVLVVYPSKIALALGATEPNLLAGARATDTEEGDLTGKIATTGTVNTRVPGAYPVEYNIVDLDGNRAPKVTRTYYVGSGLTFVANFNSFGEFTELSEKVPDDTPLERRVAVADMFDGLVERGYSGISFHPVTTLFGEVGFPAPPGVNLVAKDYRDAAPSPLPDGTDRMGWVVAKAHLRGLKAFANIQAFSHVAK